MSRSSALRSGLVVLAAALFGAAFGAASASANQLVTNGGFETGTLDGWHAASETTAGKWFAFDQKEFEEGRTPFAPPSGNYAAGDEFGFIDSLTLSQEVAIPANTTDQFSMSLGYESSETMTGPPANSLATGSGGDTQYVGVDVIKAGAALDSLQPGDVLKTIYATTSAGPQTLAPTTVTADLSSLAGQSVVLRIANLVEEGPMELIADNVSIESNPVPVPPPAPPVPSNVFTTGMLKLNKKAGTGLLSVRLPDAGVLTATGVSQPVAVAGSKGKMKKAVLIKKATVTSTATGTLKIAIKPTAAGKKVLVKKGKLPFKASLTFTPTGGTAATQAYAGKLIKLMPAKK